MSLHDKIAHRSDGIVLYGIVPPKRSTSADQVAAIAARQRTRLRGLPIDGLVLYDLQDEQARTEAERPFPFLETLDPLARRGYYRGVMLAKLTNNRADAYDSPDDKGRNREFWLEMTLAMDPSVRILVAKSDDAPLSGGRWVEGVFIYRNGELEPL